MKNLRKGNQLDESYRGFISLDVGEEKLDLVDFERRFGRAALDARLAKAGLALVDDAGPGDRIVRFTSEKAAAEFQRAVLAGLLEHCEPPVGSA